ncbi:discoidin domain-containing protein [Paenibacillus hamazuiensis]|uniref:discoidin domain-containing protein n=1 Tax=Paenibacillus hamazuiensis TaxID=2936508 RepID=UPI00200BE732|nr:discoidin domain-containing protein [Paenibacillus hamazuiensis]
MKALWKKRTCGALAALLMALPVPDLAPIEGTAYAESANLALSKSVTKSSDTSSGRSANAVDGNTGTYWQPLSTDRKDDNHVWLTVDLGMPLAFNKTVVQFRTSTSAIDKYTIQASADGVNWQDIYASGSEQGAIPAIDSRNVGMRQGRYVKLDVTLNDPDRNFQLNEFEIYDTTANPPESVLESVYFAAADGRKLATDDTLTIGVGGGTVISLQGVMSDGRNADLSNATVELSSSKPAIAAVTGSGGISAIQEGVTKLTGKMTVGQTAKETSVWVDVYDPVRNVADFRLRHPSITREIGLPALLNPGDPLPTITAQAAADAALSAELVHVKTNRVLQRIPETALAAGAEKEIAFAEASPLTAPGLYEIRLKLSSPGKPDVYDSFSFTVSDPDADRTGQSAVAFIGDGGRLEYVPDFKGNRVLDFSNSGYMGGGVRLPDVQARVVVEPGEGDDTARIQAAIDRVSQLPQSVEGFRGAVLMKKGTYEIAGSLRINASGVVLRGEGQGEDGTTLYATGATRRDILQIGGTRGAVTLPETKTAVADLFVPSGARSFHVENAAGYKVGDTIIVRRHGSDRWIHALSMDSIVQRPGSGGTQQWAPFDLDFDRVITKIEGNLITVDAPLANSIERRWGGADVYKYDDQDRIEQVGVENLRVDVQFDPSVTSKTMDNGSTDTPYYADENHAVSFAVLGHVKNAWVRDVTGKHLEHALVQMDRGSKWITVQDCTVTDFVSIITGGRRYAFHQSGQLSLVQRNYVETARHAFVVDSRIPGPNVFLEGKSKTDFNTSEPHHRWSVGGLYDNVKSDIAIRDRGWLGSGHGWSGANYVTWNTEGELVSQQPPTAQNYAIGHVGTKVKPFLPNADDPRPRKDAYWESLGAHVQPGSLYKQQLQDRLDAQALQNIARTPVGGGALDVPVMADDLPLLKGIKINGKAMEGFKPSTFDYVVQLPPGTNAAAQVEAHDMRHDMEYIQASHLYGKAVIISRDKKDPAKSVRYTVRFKP